MSIQESETTMNMRVGVSEEVHIISWSDLNLVVRLMRSLTIS